MNGNDCIRCEDSTASRTKKGNTRKTKVMGLKQTIIIRILEA
jgi:hypothetical protein